jgi:hypothetical protein
MQHADFVASGDGRRSRGNISNDGIGGNISNISNDGNIGGIGDIGDSIDSVSDISIVGNISNVGIGDISNVGDSDIDSIGIGGIDSIGGVGGIMMSCDIRSSDSSDVGDSSGVDDALVSKSVSKRLYAQCHSVVTSVNLVSSVKLPSGLSVSDISLYVSLYLSHLDLAALSVLSEQQVDMIEATHRSLL